MIQSTSSIESKLEKLLTRSDRSLSGVFKSIRKDRSISFIGDYPILKHILIYGYYRTPQYLWNRRQVLRAIQISGFYKDEGYKQAYIPNDFIKYIHE